MIICVFVEITPIKINPIQWLGNRLFKSTNESISKMEKKLDEHIAQSYRNKILSFQNECLRNVKHTQEQFDEVLEAIDEYENYCKINEIKNGKTTEAIKFIKKVYQRTLLTHDFVDLTQIQEVQQNEQQTL